MSSAALRASQSMAQGVTSSADSIPPAPVSIVSVKPALDHQAECRSAKGDTDAVRKPCLRRNDHRPYRL